MENSLLPEYPQKFGKVIRKRFPYSNHRSLMRERRSQNIINAIKKSVNLRILEVNLRNAWQSKNLVIQIIVSFFMLPKRKRQNIINFSGAVRTLSNSYDRGFFKEVFSKKSVIRQLWSFFRKRSRNNLTLIL